MHKSISPWINEIELKSPCGLYVASYFDGAEVAMGAPTMGKLKVGVRVISGSAASSMVWSEDSRYLAFPEWTRNRSQILSVYHIDEDRIVRLPVKYRVIELQNFSKGKIVGIDSPIHRPRTISISYNGKLNNFEKKSGLLSKIFGRSDS